MKVIYLNNKGVGNIDIRMSIKSLYDKKKFDMVLIAKQIIPYANFLAKCLK